MTCLFASMVIWRPCFLNIRQISFLMFSVILGVVSVTANPSSLYRPILSPNLVCSCDNRKPPTSSHVSAPSKLPMVTSKVLELFFCHCCCLLVRSEFCLDDDISLLGSDFVVYRGKVQCFIQEILTNRWVKFDDVETYEVMFVLVIDAVEPFYNWRCIFPLVDLCGCYNFLVNSVENLLTYFADFRFSRVDQSTSVLVCKVRFMIFQGYKCFLFGRDIYPVVDAKFYCDFLILLLDLLCCIVVSFLVRFCDVLLEEFVVLLWF